jgi:chemosensory pili system protein ChpA (sensor histidine kinase/response regulator)
MAGEQDPLDLVGLFGLNDEEALSLGLPHDGAGASTDPASSHTPVAIPRSGDLRYLPFEDPTSDVPRRATTDPMAVRGFMPADPSVRSAVDGDLATLEAEVLRVLGAPPAPVMRTRQSLPDERAPGAFDDRTVPQPSALEVLLRRVQRGVSAPQEGGDPAREPVEYPAQDTPQDATPDAPLDQPAAPPDVPARARFSPLEYVSSAPEDVLGAPSAVPSAPLPPEIEEVGSPPAFLQELLAVFVEEATELLDGFHTTLEMLERGPSPGAVAEARRQVHTIKGGARMCGLGDLADLAHVCEDVLTLSGSDDRQVAHRTIALLFRAEQAMRAALGIPSNALGTGADAATLITELQTLAHPADAQRATARLAGPVPAARDSVAEATTVGDAAADFEEQPGPGPRQGTAERGAVRGTPAAVPAPHGARMAVDLHKVEGVVAKVTEIVANRATSHNLLESLSANVMDVMRTVHRLQAVAMQLQYQIASEGMDVTEGVGPDGLPLETYGPIKQSLLQLHEAIADQQALVQQTIDAVNSHQSLAATETRLDTDLQSALLNMRLLPLSQLRVRLDQVVRSAASSLGREVRWSMEGQHVSLDKNVCDRLFEPLLHLLRNAIDHGIEPPEERVAGGKPRAGRIVVQASIEGNQATISVSDDGRGIDPERITSVAVARGIITEQQGLAMSEAEKLELIFRPGFSTAGTVSDLSGRGVGMEIVRETCIRMGGTVSVSARPGGGTTTSLHVPLSLSLIHALIVNDCGRKLCIPAPQVISVHLVRPASLTEHGGRQFVRIGRDNLQLFRLPPPVAPMATANVTPPDELTVLLVPLHSIRVAVVVDEVVSEEDLIVKPLPLLLQGVDRLLGAVVLATGEAVPVLNLPPQLEYLQGLTSAPTVALTAVAPMRSEPLVLVVDDSLTMRTALTQTLSSAGYAVLAARDGQEALELIRTRGMPRLVTLDVEMPRMDGLETLYAIRHLSGGEHVPVFMLTTRSGQKYQRTALQLGANRYFTKPYHDREFLRAVREVAGGPQRPTG